MTQTPSRDWQKDMEMCRKSHMEHYGLADVKDALIHWLQEAKERGEREQRLKEAIENALKWTWYHGEANMTEIDTVLNDILATLYPDTPAQEEGK